MGKKKASSSLGKGIIKDRSKTSKFSKVNDSWLHTSELNDGYDWNRINLRSVTEQSNLEDFLETAELAGTEFTAERLNVKVIDPSQHTGLPSTEESIAITKAQRENLDFLQIPRRPKWDSSTTPEQLNQREKETFLEWRRQLSLLQEKEHIVLTPFERNLDFWRQLWRVIERSDIIVQIVDARNPLLFRCEDLEKYVKEVNIAKENVILISKADLLTQAQREHWAKYFSQQGMRVAFWSAVRETERIEQKEAGGDDARSADVVDSEDEGEEDDEEEEEEEDGDEDNEDVKITSESRYAPDDLLTGTMEELTVGDQGPGTSLAMNQEKESSEGNQGPIGLRLGTSAVDNEDQDHACQGPSSSAPCNKDHEHMASGSDSRLSADGEATVSSAGDAVCGACSDTNETPSVRSTLSGGDSMSVPSGRTDEVENRIKVEEKSSSDNASLDCGVEEDDAPRTRNQVTFADDCGTNSDERTSCAPSPQVASTSSTHGDDLQSGSEDAEAASCQIHNAAHLLTGQELLNFLREIHSGRSKVDKEVLTVGMVGYPNVGKSSTINALLREKKVPVSATPGRTKHFQTLFVEPTLCLCDCPGLVMPSFVSTKADMYLNGILPIDQMRDFTPPVSLLCQRMPRKVLELTYGINLIKPGEGEDQERPPTALELLNAHAYVRGFMTHKGVPDCFRSARIVLKDYVNGKLLYRMPPPSITPEEFESIHFPSEEIGEVKAGSRPKKSANKPAITEGGQTVKKSAAKKVDESFFVKPSAAHIKTGAPRVGVAGQGAGAVGKPWKKQKRGKKEKLRRVYGHLDEK